MLLLLHRVVTAPLVDVVGDSVVGVVGDCVVDVVGDSEGEDLYFDFVASRHSGVSSLESSCSSSITMSSSRTTGKSHLHGRMSMSSKLFFKA